MSVYVLVESKLLAGNEISDRVIGVTFDLTEAEEHKAKGVEFEFREFSLPCDLVSMGAETTTFLKQMREFKEDARAIQQMIVDATLEGQG